MQPWSRSRISAWKETYPRLYEVYAAADLTTIEHSISRKVGVQTIGAYASTWDKGVDMIVARYRMIFAQSPKAYIIMPGKPEVYRQGNTGWIIDRPALLLEGRVDKRHVVAVYNLISSGYGKPALRYALLNAHRLVALSDLQVGQKILDVATGTGAVAIPAAQVVGMTGQVIGVDIAQDMLTQARRNVATVDLGNIDLCGADAEHLPFKDNSVDIVICASALYFLPDMLAALREWRRVTKPGGRVTFSLFGETAFQPLADIYKARLCQHGVSPAILTQAFAWQRLTDPEICRALLQDAGFARIDVCTEQLGYYLHDVSEWWDIIWNSGFRGAMSPFSPVQMEEFKAEHLAEIRALATDRGIWLDGMAIFARGWNVPRS